MRSLRSSLLDDSIETAEAKEADVIVLAESEGKVDGFIDDTICVGLYAETNWFRLASYVPHSIHTMVRPGHDKEPI
eukprot:15165618-Ditylum_brightwellii.AAC.1